MPRFGKDMNQLELSYIVGGKTFGKRYCIFLSIHIYQGHGRIWSHKVLYTNVHISICNSPKWEKKQNYGITVQWDRTPH